MIPLQYEPKSAWQPFQPTAENPWSNRRVAHLFRRAGFGGSIEQIVAAQAQGLQTTLERIFDFQPAEKYELVMAKAGRLVASGADAKGLAAWWLLRMAKTPCPLQEKMTLFWHGHFATGADKVQDARAMLTQNGLIRDNCLGNFRELVSQLSRDVAMLVYLDSTENRKTRPNENYARELMELFCLGPGNYSETDIKEIARCFTGWEVFNKKFKFNSYQHDEGQKEFLGARGRFDGDDAIEVILKQPAAGTFLAKKLIRFFVFDDEPISDELAEPIAEELRAAKFDIQPATRKILSSELFFSERAIARKVKSPIELAISALRFFDASINMQQLAVRLERLGQLPLYPPNVKGWEGGRVWINAATILARANLLDELLSNRQTTFKSGSLNQWCDAHSSFGVKASNEWTTEYLLAIPLPPQAQALFEQQMSKDPALALSMLAALPEFQLN